MSKYHPYKVNKLLASSRFIATISERDILHTNWTRHIRCFSFVFEMCCLTKNIKDIFKNLHQQSKNKSSTFINYGNDETKTQKSLIPKEKPKHFDHTSYKERRILKFRFVFAINNKDCNARWSISFCLSTLWIIYLA